MKRALVCASALAIAVSACTVSKGPSASSSRVRILVLTRTQGFHHASIATAVAAVVRLGAEHGFGVIPTQDPSMFTDVKLAPYRAVVFLLTTGDVLTDAQQAAFERYIARGGGYVGVHSASDTEYAWAWYGRLVGAFFKNHPPIQRATVHVLDGAMASTTPLPARWTRSDEWYNFRTDPSARVHVLLTVDERTYSGGTMGAQHPIAWCHDFDGGRSWYTAMGHASSAYSEPLFMAHLLRGIEYASRMSATRCPTSKT